MENLRVATKKDFKVGTRLIDQEGNKFLLIRKYAGGIWECQHKAHFEKDAKFYFVENK